MGSNFLSYELWLYCEYWALTAGMLSNQSIVLYFLCLQQSPARRIQMTYCSSKTNRWEVFTCFFPPCNIILYCSSSNVNTIPRQEGHMNLWNSLVIRSPQKNTKFTILRHITHLVLPRSWPMHLIHNFWRGLPSEYNSWVRDCDSGVVAVLIYLCIKLPPEQNDLISI